MVYRLSIHKTVEYLRLKVDRLAVPEVLEVSRTSIRGLAKDGLMEDGKENLLKSKYLSILTGAHSQHNLSGAHSSCMRFTGTVPLRAHASGSIGVIRVCFVS